MMVLLAVHVGAIGHNRKSMLASFLMHGMAWPECICSEALLKVFHLQKLWIVPGAWPVFWYPAEGAMCANFNLKDKKKKKDSN